MLNKQYSPVFDFDFMSLFQCNYHLVRYSTAVTRPHCNDKDVGLNPAAAKNENWTLGWPPAQKCPNSPTGSKWKTSDVNLN